MSQTQKVAEGSAPEIPDNLEDQLLPGNILKVPLFHPDATELAKQASLAFRAALPALLGDKRNRGRWIAFHGQNQVGGIANTALELYQRCAALGFADTDYIVRPIEPLPPDVVFLDC
jgi:hypothetical protein